MKAMGLTQGHWFKCPNGEMILMKSEFNSSHEFLVIFFIGLWEKIVFDPSLNVHQLSFNCKCHETGTLSRFSSGKLELFQIAMKVAYSCFKRPYKCLREFAVMQTRHTLRVQATRRYFKTFSIVKINHRISVRCIGNACEFEIRSSIKLRH